MLMPHLNQIRMQSRRQMNKEPFVATMYLKLTLTIKSWSSILLMMHGPFIKTMLIALGLKPESGRRTR
ncbi:hypothetical protein LINPERHAP1_LOCUS18887 [Linum perenne]